MQSQGKWLYQADGGSTRQKLLVRHSCVIGKIVWKNTDTPESVILAKGSYEEIVSEQFDIAIVTRALKDGGYLKCGSNGTTKSGTEKTSVYKKCWINGSVQMAIEFDAEKMGIFGNDAVAIERVTPTYDDEGVTNGTLHETYKIVPEVIDADGTSSKYDPTRPPDPEPLDKYELAYGEPTEVKRLNERGEPVEIAEHDDSEWMVISNGHIEYSKEEPF